MKKILFQKSNGMISVVRTLFRRKHRLRGGMPTFNAVLQTQMILNAQVAQIRQLSQKKNVGWGRDLGLKLREIVEELKISEGGVFTNLFEHLSMFKVGATFALSRSKTTTRRRFRALFVTVSTEQKGVFP